MTDKEKRFLEIEKRLEAQAKVNPVLVRLNKLAAEQGKEILKEYEAEFNKVLDGYKDYCRVNGLVIPKDTKEFFSWVALRYPDENLPFIIEVAKNPYNYKLFHDYKERLFTKPNWDSKKEREYLQSYFEQSNTEPQQEIQSLSDLICHTESAAIVDAIKIKYRNIQGKRLKLLLLSFQELGLIPQERVASKFHKLCKKEFEWNIASYTAMNDYEFNKIIDASEKQQMKQFIEQIIQPSK